MNEEQIRKLLESNQTAIKQLGEDIKKLRIIIDDKHAHGDLKIESMYRDMADRWQMIHDWIKELKECLEK